MIPGSVAVQGCRGYTEVELTLNFTREMIMINTEVEFTKKFIPGQKVFDTAGYSYLYAAEDPRGGHLVSEIILIQSTTYEGDDFDEHEEEGQLKHLTSIYEAPPKKKLDDDIFALSSDRSAIKNELGGLKSELSQLQRDISSHKAKLEAKISEFPHHENIVKLLNAQRPIVLIGSEEGLIYVDDNPRHREFKVAIDTGDITPLGNWNDYGSDIAFYSLEDAAEYFTQNVPTDYTKLNSTSLYSLSESYKRLGLSIPVGITNRRKEQKQAEIEKITKTAHDSVERIQGQIDNI